MACRNSVASEEFADFIAPYFTSPENFMRSQGTDCIDFVNSTLAVVYIPFSTITSFSYTSYTQVWMLRGSQRQMSFRC